MESAKTGTYILPRAFPSSRMKWEGRAPNRELRDLPGQYTEGNKVLQQMELLRQQLVYSVGQSVLVRKVQNFGQP